MVGDGVRLFLKKKPGGFPAPPILNENYHPMVGVRCGVGSFGVVGGGWSMVPANEARKIDNTKIIRSQCLLDVFRLGFLKFKFKFKIGQTNNTPVTMFTRCI